MELLKAENLVKEYPGVTAVDGVSFGILFAFSIVFFSLSLRNVRRKWIL